MGIHKRAMVAGMSHELTRRGIVSWPSKQAEEMVTDEIADSFEDEEVPEMTDESGLTEEEAAAVLDQIVEVAEQLEAKTGGVKDADLNKTAAAADYQKVASQTAVRLMHKAAEETSVATGPAIPGDGSAPTPDNSATAEGKVDEKNTPSSAIVGPQGTTDVNTKPGAVGVEMPQVSKPGATESDPTGEVAKLSHLIESLTKHASAGMDGASLSGGSAAGPSPTPRKDLEDNLVIPKVVASGQGKTTQPEPAAANVGIGMRNPAGTPGVTAPTNNEPAKDAIKKAAEALRQTPAGRKILFKLGEEAKRAQDEDLEQQEVAVADQLTSLAGLFT